MKKKIILKISFIPVAVLLLQCCLFTKDGCKLTSADEEWLLEEYDSLVYLRNGRDTISVRVETRFGQDQYDYVFGIRTGDNDYYGYSRINFIINSYSDSITFFTWINGCDEKLHVKSIKNWNSNKAIHVSDYYAIKDSITNLNLSISGKIYNNCFNFSDQSDTVLQEFVFVKNYGVVKFLTHTGDLFELVPFD